MSLDDWLKPGEDDPDLPDLGLNFGPLSAEDIKWVDLEFLDLASGPPANQDKNRNKNPTLGYNFPDIFFGDATSSSVFNTHFSVDDFKPFGDSLIKDSALDLDTVEKNFLEDFFPPPTNIEQNQGSTDDLEFEKATRVEGGDDDDKDAVYDEMQIISKNLSQLRKDFETRQEQQKLSYDGDKDTDIDLSNEGDHPAMLVTKSPLSEEADLAACDEPLADTTNHCLGKAVVHKPLDMITAELGVSDQHTQRDKLELQEGFQFRNMKVVKNQMSVRKLAELGIELDGMTCATSEDGQKVWICHEVGCRKSYSRPSKLKIHLLAHRDVKPFKCSYPGCSWSFVTNSKLNRHMGTHKKEKKFSCGVNNCGRRFSTKFNLRKHLQLHEKKDESGNFHISAIKQVRAGFNEVCTVSGCGKRFHKPSQLKMHYRAHNGIRPFVCQFQGCKWAFTSSSKLRRHERSHQNIRNHVCQVCQKRYLRAEHLRDHVSTQHVPWSSVLKCPVIDCEDEFSSKAKLRSHINEYHNAQKSWKEVNFRCAVKGCQRGSGTFHSTEELRYHTQTFHNSEFQCPGFRKSSNGPNHDLAVIFASQ